MLAAAAVAEDDDAPVPPELTLAWQVERWGSAAVLGPAPIPTRLLKRMAATGNVYSAFMSYSAGKFRLADWAKANPIHSQIVTDIRMMRQNQ